MLLLLGKVNRGSRAILLLLVMLSSLSVGQQNTLAEEENPYLNLTPAEASGVLNRLISNPELLQKFSEERKNQLTSAEVFQKTILAQQKDLLTRRNLSQLIVLKKLVIGLYPSDSEVRTRYDAISTFSERLEYLIATGSIESLVETRKIDSLLPEEKQLLDSSLLGYIKSSVADKLAIKKSSEALNNLILLPDELWAAEGKTLANSIFAGMVKDEASFSSDQVERLFNRLISVVQIEPTSKPALQGIFENSTYSASDRGDKTETLKLLSQMRKFSDNKLSAPFVEELLLDHPSGLDSENAEKLIEELKQRGELSTKFKLKLMWDGYFGPLVPILIGLSIALPIIGLTIFGIVWVRRKLENLKIDNPF